MLLELNLPEFKSYSYLKGSCFSRHHKRTLESAILNINKLVPIYFERRLVLGLCLKVTLDDLSFVTQFHKQRISYRA